MIDEAQARAIARRYLDTEIQPKSAVDIVLTEIEAYESCWVVSYNTRSFVESGDLRQSLAGNGPLIVNRVTGRVRQGSSSRPTEDQLYDE